jgi:transcriptional regulator with XRE-family HTH domain
MRGSYATRTRTVNRIVLTIGHTTGTNSSVRERIRELRSLADGMSTLELDALAGFSHGHVSRIERKGSKAKRTSVDAVVKIAAVFGVTLDELVLGVDWPPNARKVQAAVTRARARAERKSG